jgi:hypothetical protein
MTTWTAAYLRYGTSGEAEFATLDGAVGFACDGEEHWLYAIDKITGPGGAVLTGEVLHQAKMRFMMPDRYGSLSDMRLAPASPQAGITQPSGLLVCPVEWRPVRGPSSIGASGCRWCVEVVGMERKTRSKSVGRIHACTRKREGYERSC